ncbi:protein hydE [Helicobacter baculiformis]|uniref:Protein hydE n=1 Tax=Helicobacter baculiformis TaxID=427351 RepID=A0ABV7ZIX3_9HELI|nr:protein hydE [Helicobacter baculiformis]
MIFVFKFESVGEFGAQVGALFMDFLAHHAHAKNLRYATSLEHFYLQATAEQAENFAQMLSQRLPVALSFRFVGVEITQDINAEWQDCERVCPPIDVLEERVALDQGLLEPHFSSFIYKNQTCYTPQQVQESLKDMVCTLQGGGSLEVKTSRGVKTLSCTYLEGAKVLFLDLASVLSLTRSDSKSAQVLCAFEKPSIIATLKEVFVNEFKNLEICASLPYDFGLALLGHRLLEKDISYLFYKDSLTDHSDLSYTCTAPSFPEQTFSVAKNGLLLPHTRTQMSPTLEFVSQEAPQEPHFLIYLNFDRPSCFWVYSEGYKQLMNLHLETHPSSLLKQLQSNAKGRKLYANYKKAYPELCARLEQEPSTLQLPSANLMDFLAGLVQVMGFSPTHNTRAITTYAKTFLRTKGPHIDFKLTKEPLNLNPAPTLRSAVSYTLGGTDAPTMCFGVLDSLAEFLGNIIYDAHIKFGLDQVYLCGDVFLEKVFLDLCLQYFPKECAQVFPLKYMDYQTKSTCEQAYTTSL